VICPVLGREKLKIGNIQVDPFRDFVEAIVSGDSATAIRLLDASPLLAKERAAHGATRQAAKPNFLELILHYMYEGDTAAYRGSGISNTRCRGADRQGRRRSRQEQTRRGAPSLCC
jgi:hypothetical protein